MVYNIAHIGLLSPIKGISIVNKLINDSSIEANWFIIGGLEAYAQHSNYNWSNATITGHYRNFKQLKYYVNKYKIDIALNLSMCPESFSYTLSEAWLLGLPVIGTNLGAIGNRIQKYGGGWVVNPYNYDAVKNLITSICDIDISIPTPKSINDMLIEYKILYNSIGVYNESYGGYQ